MDPRDPSGLEARFPLGLWAAGLLASTVVPSRPHGPFEAANTKEKSRFAANSTRIDPVVRSSAW